MADQIRFTPDELQELVQNGELKQEDLARLHPTDAQVAVSAMLKANKLGDIKGVAMPPPGVAKLATGLASGLNLGGLIDTLKTVGTMWGVNKALDYANAPGDVKSAIMLALGLRGGSSGAKGAALAEEEAPLMGRIGKDSKSFPIGEGSQRIMREGRPAPNPIPNGAPPAPPKSNVERLKPGSGASVDQVGEMQGRYIHGAAGRDALGMGEAPRVQRRSPFERGKAEYTNPGSSKLPEKPFGLDVKSPEAFKDLQRTETELQYSDPAAEGVMRRKLAPMMSSHGGKSAKFAEGDQSAQQLEELLDAIYGPGRSNKPNGGR